AFAVLMRTDPSGHQVVLRHDSVSGAFDAISSLAIQPDGKIVAGGNSSPASSATSEMLVRRYRPDLSIDSAFGTNGAVVTKVDAQDDTIETIALSPDGGIVAVGQAVTTAEVGRGGFEVTAGDAIVAKYTSAGKLDKSFRNGGVFKFDFPGAVVSGCDDAAITPDGKIAIAGDAEYLAADGTDAYLASARLLPDGRFDPSFNKTGSVVNKSIGTLQRF